MGGGVFFAGATAISHAAARRPCRASMPRAPRRDWVQVMANGGAAALGAWHPEAGVWMVSAALGRRRCGHLGHEQWWMERSGPGTF